ncbi:MAG: class II glutamine amidotransferase [Arenicellales bacterium]|jgi:glutamate synthase domain-containing protein 1|nr:class II glutamine amidotransferase [Arenicellales bacterium]MDP6314007.1 class II glutamine amidotransferase [Arenicellales bacterium]MDP7119300.1 class II glutamine amidotransferase [Arenicellales bacterium]MDP7488997.1 class II glutamine amidotransferase [Arenicellales bacterium]
MCGIAGIMYRGEHAAFETGDALIRMLDGCQHRGPDSTGFALYSPAESGRLKLRFFLGGNGDGAAAVAAIRERLTALDAQIEEEAQIGHNYQVTIAYDGDVQHLSYEMEHTARVISIGVSLEIVKDVGSALELDQRYNVRSFRGTHGLGHVRLATESEVRPDASHPFWATGFADVAIVHNGQITNYWKMRRRLQQRGFEFTTDNDSELIAVYLADKLAQGITLQDCLASSIDDLDGTFSFLVSTKDEIGYAKDRLAAKPMILYQDENLVAVASEEVSLNRLFPGRALDTREPAPGTYATWSRSTSLS